MSKASSIDGVNMLTSATSVTASSFSSVFSRISLSHAYRTFSSAPCFQDAPWWVPAVVLGSSMATLTAGLSGFLWWRKRRSRILQQGGSQKEGTEEGKELGLGKSDVPHKVKNTERKEEEEDEMSFLDTATFAFMCALREVEEQHFYPLKATLDEIRGLVSTLGATFLSSEDGEEEMKRAPDAMRKSTEYPSSSISHTVNHQRCDMEPSTVQPHDSTVKKGEEERGSGRPHVGEVEEDRQTEFPWMGALRSATTPSTAFSSHLSDDDVIKKESPTAHSAASCSSTGSARSEGKRYDRRLVVRLHKLFLECNELLTRYMISLDELPVAGKIELKQKRKALLITATEWSEEIAGYHQQYFAPPF